MMYCATWVRSQHLYKERAQNATKPTIPTTSQKETSVKRCSDGEANAIWATTWVNEHKMAAKT
jgi:hypothetical protein